MGHWVAQDDAPSPEHAFVEIPTPLLTAIGVTPGDDVFVWLEGRVLKVRCVAEELTHLKGDFK